MERVLSMEDSSVHGTYPRLIEGWSPVAARWIHACFTLRGWEVDVHRKRVNMRWNAARHMVYKHARRPFGLYEVRRTFRFYA